MAFNETGQELSKQACAMKQNIFDNPKFFGAYMEFRRRDDGFNAALENPTMISLLPSLDGKHVLDIGCGVGNLCRHVASHGASRTLGIDPSERKLSLARSSSAELGERVEYLQTFVEDFNAPPGSFHLILSSLAIHYMEDITSVFSNVFRWLSPEGVFVFSIDHPMLSAGPRKWIRDSGGDEFWAVSDYFAEGRREFEWHGERVVKYHRTIETLVGALAACGFRIELLVEPRPDDQLLLQRPELAVARDRPEFLFIRARRATGESA
jgi:SAM-dependent methyltransferase